MSRKSLRPTALSGLRWTAAARLLTQLITWGTTFWVVRLLYPSDYGLVAMATVVTGYLAIWNELGFGITIVQRQIDDEVTLRKIFSVLFFVGAALFLAMLALAPIIATVFKEPRVAPLAIIAATHFLLVPFGVIPQATLSMRMRFSALSKITFFSSILGALTTIVLANMGGGAYALIVGTLVAMAGRTVCLNVLAPRFYLPGLSMVGMRQLTAHSGLVLVERTIWYWYSQIDLLIVGRLFGTSSLGTYSLGSQLALMPMDRASEIVNSVALPVYASVKDDLARVREGYLKAARMCAALAFPVFWGLALIASDLVPVVLGEKWLASIPIIQLLCIAMPLRTVNTLASPMLMAIGHVRATVWLVAVAAAVVTVGIVIGTQWGIAGVAAAWAVAYPLAFALNARRIARIIGASAGSVLSPLWIPCISAAIMFLIGRLIAQEVLPLASALVRMAIAVPLGASTYIVAFRLLDRTRFAEAFDLFRAVARGR